jgi:Fe2+ transport system protein FeoA
VQKWGLLPGCQVTIIEQRDDEIIVQVEERAVSIPLESANVIWVEIS